MTLYCIWSDPAPNASERCSKHHDEVMSIWELEHICEFFLNPLNQFFTFDQS